ncbi:hypothetical protein FKV68_00315 [Sinorhizobium mexicanum]|uniref:Uncharacterized protein n=1 Tax=Sinorhizobium mexicanum TaxID=375549 RepID=A0A859QEG3_9HYPH|nr:hypothetical protein FKV68_00315 [Sinorhizobium mexicanum]
MGRDRRAGGRGRPQADRGAVHRLGQRPAAYRASLDHDDFGSNRPEIINVIDSKKLSRGRAENCAYVSSARPDLFQFGNNSSHPCGIDSE